jgi:hypothetical protein
MFLTYGILEGVEVVFVILLLSVTNVGEIEDNFVNVTPTFIL